MYRFKTIRKKIERVRPKNGLIKLKSNFISLGVTFLVIFKHILIFVFSDDRILKDINTNKSIVISIKLEKEKAF